MDKAKLANERDVSEANRKLKEGLSEADRASQNKKAQAAKDKAAAFSKCNDLLRRRLLSTKAAKTAAQSDSACKLIMANAEASEGTAAAAADSEAKVAKAGVA